MPKRIYCAPSHSVKGILLSVL